MNTYFSRSLKNASNMLQDLAEHNFVLREYLLSNRDQLIGLFQPKPFYVHKIRKNKRIHVNMKKIILDYVKIQRRYYE